MMVVLLLLAAAPRLLTVHRVPLDVRHIRRVANPVLRHRISTNFQAQAEGMTTDDLIGRLIKEVPEPTVDKYD